MVLFNSMYVFGTKHQHLSLHCSVVDRLAAAAGVLPQAVSAKQLNITGSLLFFVSFGASTPGYDAAQQMAVMVSMQSTKGFWVKYLESLKAYSFHICPMIVCFEPIVAKLQAKYPSNTR